MDSGWISAAASLVSALIVAVTALAAFRQLRHYRNANDIVVYLRLIEQMDSPAMLEARAAVAVMARRFEADPTYRQGLTDPAFLPDELRPVAAMLRFLEHISVLVIKGGIAEGLILAEYADIFVGIWDHMYPAMLERRVAFGPQTARAFEHLAMRARRYIESGEMAREYDRLERDPRAVR